MLSRWTVMRGILPLCLIAAGLLPGVGHAQVSTLAPDAVAGAQPVNIERVKVRSAAVAGNLEGNAAERDMLVVLPPSYGKQRKRRYPVVYALHGYSIGAEQWSKEIHIPRSIEGAFAQGAGEMIVVLPDSKTVHNGSMYSRSATTGDFEMFVARDVVAYVDAHYRTLARRESRGLVGHSMGGYGAARIGMKHADVFGALYMMSPCCLSNMARPMDAATMAALSGVKSIEEATKLNWGQRAALATASAWAPNPKNPPLFLDLPFENGEPRADVIARFTANSPLAFFDQYVPDLRRYAAISLDVGDKDGLKADAEKLHAAMDRNGIAHGFEIYAGDHTSHIGLRFQQKVLPFFAQHLRFTR